MTRSRASNEHVRWSIQFSAAEIASMPIALAVLSFVVGASLLRTTGASRERGDRGVALNRRA